MLYLRANEEALSSYRELAQRFACDFEERSAFVYSREDRGKIEREVRAVNSLGFPAEFAGELPLPFPVKGAVRFPHQAQFHPLKFLAGITQLIEDHISDSDLNVNSLCELSGMGSKQIYRKLKQLTGMSPVEYIKSIRMKKAAMLLKQKKFSIAEVMYMVGYSNPSYFSKCFQAAFGKTPRQYTAES